MLPDCNHDNWMTALSKRIIIIFPGSLVYILLLIVPSFLFGTLRVKMKALELLLVHAISQ